MAEKSILNDSVDQKVEEVGKSSKDDEFFTSLPSSPPKLVNMEEVMKMREKIRKTKISHEIAMQEAFKLEKKETPDLEGQVRKIMERAFWDMLDKELKEDPPKYDMAVNLLAEIKQELLNLIPLTAQPSRSMIEEVLDMDLIKQKLNNNAFELETYSSFIIDSMAKLCSPMRDDQVASLRQLRDVVPLYQEIYKVLELMKLDFANYLIEMTKPYIKQHSSKYERDQFFEILKMQQENGVDGLLYTKLWLAPAFQLILDQLTSQPHSSSSTSSSLTTPSPQPPALLQPEPSLSLQLSSSSPSPSSSSSSSSPQPPPSSSSPQPPPSSSSSSPQPPPSSSSSSSQPPSSSSSSTTINASTIYYNTLCEAYLSLFFNKFNMPETLLMDAERLVEITDKLGTILFIGVTFVLSTACVGRLLDEEFKKKIKDQLLVLFEEKVDFKQHSEKAVSLSEQVIHELQKWVEEKGYGAISAESQSRLRSQLLSCLSHSDPVDPILLLMKSRLQTFMRQLIFSQSKKDMTIPQGFSALSHELTSTAKMFVQVITHNQAVYGFFYSNLISDMIRKHNETNKNPSETMDTK